MMGTCATGATVWIGTARLGAIEVPINPELVGALLQHVVDTADATAAVVSAASVTRIADALRSAGVRHLFVPDVDDVVGASLPIDGFDTVVFGPPDGQQRPAPHTYRPSDIALILFTSGTTGPSKGVMVPWGQMEETARGSMPLDDMGADDVYYSPFSMAHVTARSGIYLMAMLGGRVVLRDRFSTAAYWSDIARHGCTTTVMMGTMAHFLINQPPSADDASSPLRNVLVAPLIPNVESLAERFGFRICTVFNMTEVSVPIASMGWQIDEIHSCGRARPGYECRVVDDQDNEVPRGTVGELVVRHRDPWKMMSGYFRSPEKTLESWRNLWFHTGDAFVCDDEGRFTFRDRIKDVIRRRGENISSVELEQQICAHPLIADAAAVGFPSAHAEEDVAVFLVAQAGADLRPADVIAFLADRVPRFMLPRYVELVDVLPRTATEKLDKKSLRVRGVSEATWDREADGAGHGEGESRG
jgi:crotonobetaine/carnitine-CoA ligase